MKISELTGAKLDYWVGRADSDEKEYALLGTVCMLRTGVMTAEIYSPSTDWSQAGPIIEREKIIPRFVDFGYFKRDPFDKKWFCCYSNNGTSEIGDTLLIAAMRCFVASKFGDTVPD